MFLQASPFLGFEESINVCSNLLKDRFAGKFAPPTHTLITSSLAKVVNTYFTRQYQLANKVKISSMHRVIELCLLLS